uniref:GN-19 n=1 Tax=Stichopus japonicus TaxID=307972 RepID=A0A2U8RM90_STIJA|nr:GN-19 precursor [Apostichopus japonicus]
MYKTAEKFFLICAVLTALLLVCNSMYIQRDDAPDGLDRYLEMKRGQMMMRDMDLLEESLKRGGRLPNYAGPPRMPWLIHNRR